MEQKTKDDFYKARELIDSGMPVSQAMQKIKGNSANLSWYYAAAKSLGEKTRSKLTHTSQPRKPRKAKALTVTTKHKQKVIDLPQVMMPVSSNKMVMIIGTKTELLDFAKGMQ